MPRAIHSSARLDDQKQIGIAGFFAAGGDQRMSLAAMMGLVVEEMRH